METIISDDVLTVRHFSVTTFTERSGEIWPNTEFRGFFKAQVPYRNPRTVTQCSTPQNHTSIMFLSAMFILKNGFFFSAIFILKKALKDLNTLICDYLYLYNICR